MSNWIIGIDTGGTFTDVAALEVTSQTLHVTKVPSTPDDPSRAVLNGLTTLMDEFPAVTPAEIQFFAHGTTVATNALLEHKGVTAGLLINRGFRAVYELRGGLRPVGADAIDTFWRKPGTGTAGRTRCARSGASIERAGGVGNCCGVPLLVHERCSRSAHGADHS
jgi:N-methylhydantoinase A